MKCENGKVIYLNRKDAEDQLSYLRKTYINAGQKAVYHCDLCGYYHLTSRSDSGDGSENPVESGKINITSEADFWKKKIGK